jgi:DNA-binding CsgD family transcriptional regulator
VVLTVGSPLVRAVKVRNYLSAAIRKLGVRNRREAIEPANRKSWF